ncbi:UDP-N-acetylmuramoyl-tripeptide--D-alanyl-D-alanine ligase [Polaribacter tangerinus]|uniref:UDP-N-acetylmuramoyl-tripeptide--D-alanyl-D- alanine ligase n=1 Tax=Polaribacter tangerinus TaxID=1920034 RepID=UPI000B4B697E|nr:UDP-N-acetylmuramoyl-tripeptide--D-alanyl-D-alanine ligase [Polaribacter tangerinus]
MQLEELYKLYTKNYLVTTDTRNIKKGAIFFALKGDHFNGNEYAIEALEKGASYAVIDEAKYHTKNTILVHEVLATLQALAKHHRKQLNIPIIGLTGSNGKTTTKELIHAVLSKKYKAAATHGNLNNHIGVPLTLLSFTKKTEIGIVEMGANHQKEIAFLSTICLPNFGYITNFGKAHLEGFGGYEGVIKGKSELYDFLTEQKGTVFINTADPLQVAKTNNTITIPFHDSLQFISAHPFVALSFKNIEIQSHLIGDYNYTNIAAAITIGNHFGVVAEAMVSAIENYVPTNNRSQLVKTDKNTLILDAYNANPSSMKAAILQFSKNTAPRKTVILGDMFELGTESEVEHQAIVDLVTKQQFLNVFYIGNHFYQTKTTDYKFKDFEDFKEYLQKKPLENQYILIKGSRGMKLERVQSLIR